MTTTPVHNIERPVTLLLEDDRRLGKVFARLLTECGCFVTRCESIADLLIAGPKGTGKLDLIVITQTKPLLGGLGTVSVIRQEGFLGPVLLIVGHLSPAGYAEAVHKGVTRILSHSVSLAEFVFELNWALHMVDQIRYPLHSTASSFRIMKNKVHRSLMQITLLAGTALLFVSTPLLRAEEMRMDHKQHAQDQALTAKPASIDAAFEQLHNVHMKLIRIVQIKRLELVSAEAQKMTAAIKELPSMASKLPPEKQQKIAGSMEALVEVLSSLRTASEGNNLSEAKKQLDAIGPHLKQLANLFPMTEEGHH